MKKIFVAIIFVTLCAGLSAHAQVVTQTTGLQLGSFVFSGSPCSISLNPITSARTVTSGSALLLPSGTPATVAKFSVTGLPNQVVTIILPSSIIVNSGSGPPMTVVPVLNGPVSRTLSPSGTITFQVGADISLPAGTAGNYAYSGFYSVTVN